MSKEKEVGQLAEDLQKVFTDLGMTIIPPDENPMLYDTHDPGISCEEAEQIINKLASGGLEITEMVKYSWVYEHVFYCDKNDGRCGRLFDALDTLK